MTEDEAKTKWCPMVRMGEGASTDNRNCEQGVISKDPGKGVQWNCCVASACMIWRWDEYGVEYLARDDQLIETGTGGTSPWKQTGIPASGHCGLGGKPWQQSRQS
jgi:hypothetical protein